MNNRIELSKILAGCLLCWLALGSPAQSRTLYVTPPGGYGTNNPPYASWADAATNIIWAVKAATNTGDQVWITNGTYSLTNTVVATNAIALKGIGGYPILDGNGIVRCLILSNTAAVADSLLLTNGNVLSGVPSWSGAGVLMWNGVLTNCIVTGCGRTNNVNLWGGGVAMMNVAVAANCQIVGNVCTNAGGGIYMSYTAEARNSLIAYNTCPHAADSSYGGAGVYLAGNASLINCTIASNVTTSYGAGVYAPNGNWKIRNCLITANSTAQPGGGLALIDSAAISTGVVQNCTFARNYASTYGGGVYARYSCRHTLINTIAYSNIAALSVPYSDYYRNDAGVAVYFTNCCASMTNTFYGTGNFTNNPLFLDAANGDFRVAPISPCVNYGVYQSWMDGARDLDGRQRLDAWSRQVDLGAYEYVRPGTLLTVH